MRNASGSGCCGSKGAKADEQSVADKPPKSGCCGSDEAAGAPEADAAGVQTGAADSVAKAERKSGCC